MSFNICIMKNPMGEWDSSHGDRHLDFHFDGKDYIELSNLRGIKLAPMEKLKGESSFDYDERTKKRFLETAKEKGCEMLGRIWFWYDDASYLPSEINKLLEECLKLKEKAQNPDQLIAMDKLITACEEALKTDSGIFLGSD